MSILCRNQRFYTSFIYIFESKRVKLPVFYHFALDLWSVV